MADKEFNIGDMMSMVIGVVMLIVISGISGIFIKKSGDITIEHFELE